jgi:hypothetical protein
MGFDFRLEYHPGATNIIADALSRHDMVDEPELVALSSPSFTIFDSLRAELATSTELQHLQMKVTAGGHGDD